MTTGSADSASALSDETSPMPEKATSPAIADVSQISSHASVPLRSCAAPILYRAYERPFSFLIEISTSTSSSSLGATPLNGIQTLPAPSGFLTMPQ